MITPKTALFVAATLSASAMSAAPATDESLNLEGWKLVWNDEFSGSKIDSAKWVMCPRGGSDWEKHMSSDPRCFVLKDGILQLRGIPNDKKGKGQSEFLTGGLQSKGKFDYMYGKIVIRARFKSAKGAWPALWMLGNKGKWPKNGELDLVEHLNHDDFVYQTVHSHWIDGLGHAGDPPKGTTAKISRDDFNTYGAEWDAEKITFTVNGAPTFSYPRVRSSGPDQWPFDQKFYLLLTMQIGGSWVGPADPAQYPAWMDIDWVRVYQRPAEAGGKKTAP